MTRFMMQATSHLRKGGIIKGTVAVGSPGAGGKGELEGRGCQWQDNGSVWYCNSEFQAFIIYLFELTECTKAARMYPVVNHEWLCWHINICLQIITNILYFRKRNINVDDSSCVGTENIWKATFSSFQIGNKPKIVLKLLKIL